MTGEWPCLKAKRQSRATLRRPIRIVRRLVGSGSSEISVGTRTHARLRSPECRQFARSARSLHRGGRQRSPIQTDGIVRTALQGRTRRLQPYSPSSTSISIHTRRGGYRGRPRSREGASWYEQHWDVQCSCNPASDAVALVASVLQLDSNYFSDKILIVYYLFICLCRYVMFHYRLIIVHKIIQTIDVLWWKHCLWLWFLNF